MLCRKLQRKDISLNKLRALAAIFKENVILILIQIVLAKELRNFLLEIIEGMEKTYKF